MEGDLVFVHLGFGTDAVPYADAWDLQRRLHAARVANEIPDVCLLLEHQPVYTAGKRTGALDRPVVYPGAPVIDVDRGGKITWHGPGQLVGYPILKLAEPMDVISYVRVLEEAMIRASAAVGVTGSRVEGRSGAWVLGSGPAPAWDRKFGQIGARVSRGVTMHGFALNCDCDLTWFGRVVPCGIRDAGVTSLTAEAGRPVSVPDMVGLIEAELAPALGARSWYRTGLADLLPSSFTPVAT